MVENGRNPIIIFLTDKPILQQIARCVNGSSPTELVEHSDVGIHVVNVVGVGGVLGDVPLLWFGALSAEHVSTVLGLIIHTVETCHLHTRKHTFQVLFWCLFSCLRVLMEAK